MKLPAANLCRPRRDAYLMIEMVVLLSILAIFMVVISQLFVIAFNARKHSDEKSALLARVDAAIGHLRRDIWTASALSADISRLEITPAGPDDKTLIVWQAKSGQLTRTVGQNTTTFKNVP